MSDLDPSDSSERPGQPGTTRTWWHPLLARLLDHVLATAYQVFEEVLVGKLPLRLDILLIRREAGELSEASHQDLAVLLPLLNRFTLMQFKGPTDALQRGDLAQLVGCAFLWHSQQAEPIPQRDISLIVLAPTVNAAVRDELELLGCQIGEPEPGIFRVAGLQVQQFRSLGEDFAMQHKDSEYPGEVEEELQTAVLEAIPAEKRLRGLLPEERLRGLLPEERLRGLPPEARVRGLSPEELLGSLSEEQAARLRELLERRRGT